VEQIEYTPIAIEKVKELIVYAQQTVLDIKGKG